MPLRYGLSYQEPLYSGIQSSDHERSKIEQSLNKGNQWKRSAFDAVRNSVVIEALIKSKNGYG